MGRLIAPLLFSLLCFHFNTVLAIDKAGSGIDKKKVILSADEIENLKKQNATLLEQKEKLQQALEKEKEEHDQSVKELTAQKKLLIDEQRKIIENTISLRKSLANLSKDSGNTSEREQLLSNEISKLTKEQEDLIQERLKGKEDRETLHSLVIAHKTFKKTFAEQQDRCLKIDEDLRQCSQLNEDQGNQFLREKNSNITLNDKLLASDAMVEKYRKELIQANDIIKALEIEKQNYNLLKQQYSDLEKSLTETRNLLVLKETELKILAESGNIAGQCNNFRASVANRQSRNFKQDNNRTNQLEPAFTDQGSKNKQLPAKQTILTIIQDEALLRSGPGNNFAPVLKVQKGSRFVVQSQQGNFYQVVTANGQGAFVQKELATVGVESNSNQDSAYKTEAPKPSSNFSQGAAFQDQSEDAQAFEAIRTGVKRAP
ncbi:MAG: hypothetical protein IT292_12485 [Deltaproteobacteria bacterium]|nr:hypothetical protein [Deltaproteobacteria bacterium]